MSARASGILLAALVVAGCATIRPVSPSEADRIRSGWERDRSAAWSPRRFKAMWKGDLSPTVGPIAHGYLLVWWDGTTLTWRASAPLAGNVRAGTLSKNEAGGRSPIPGKLGSADAIGLLLGALDLPATARPVEQVGKKYRLFLDGYGRSATLDGELAVIGLELPDQTRVSYVPGEGLPRKIEAVSRDGRARLSLESLGPWPEGEPIPPA